MSSKHGNLSITSENIFPVIKKWLYSDHDIFFRELISNGCDAITKLKTGHDGGIHAPEDYKGKIEVIVNPGEKTLTFIDNGLGMTADEVDEYINQIAFSGATDFLRNTRTRPARGSDYRSFRTGLTRFLWWPTRYNIDTPLLARRTPPACIGNATAVPNLDT